MLENQQNYSNPPPNYSSIHATNTFSSKPSMAQIIAYITIVLQIIAYYSCMLIYFNVPLIVIYTFFGIIVIITGWISSYIDPTDRSIYKYKWSIYLKKSVDDTEKCYCEQCDSYCSQNAKHCRVCNRCAFNFDHHCIWINNCIGDYNYKYFFIMIISVFMHLLTFIIHGIFTSISVKITDYWIQLSFIWLLMVILLIFCILLINLIALHIYLNFKGLTTYQFLRMQKTQELVSKSKKKFQELNFSLNSIKVQSQQITNIQRQSNNNSTAILDVQKLESQKIKQQQTQRRYPKIFVRNPSLTMLMSGQAQSPSKRNLNKVQ